MGETPDNGVVAVELRHGEPIGIFASIRSTHEADPHVNPSESEKESA